MRIYKTTTHNSFRYGIKHHKNRSREDCRYFFDQNTFHVTYAKKGKLALAIEPTCRCYVCSSVCMYALVVFSC